LASTNKPNLLRWQYNLPKHTVIKLWSAFFLLLVVLCSSCVTNAYYLSAFNANSHYYPNIPMAHDSVISATYLGSHICVGSANIYFRGNTFFQYSLFTGVMHLAYLMPTMQPISLQVITG